MISGYTYYLYTLYIYIYIYTYSVTVCMYIYIYHVFLNPPHVNPSLSTIVYPLVPFHPVDSYQNICHVPWKPSLFHHLLLLYFIYNSILFASNLWFSLSSSFLSIHSTTIMFSARKKSLMLFYFAFTVIIMFHASLWSSRSPLIIIIIIVVCLSWLQAS